MISKMKNRVAGGFTLIELMVVVAIIGILAAVAIPAFMKNARKAKTAEAVINVKKLFDGARSYWEEELVGRGSILALPKQFPESVARTPGARCCPKCAPDPSLWTDESWHALKFSMDDPHYFQYEYSAVGAGVGSNFAAMAYGDLNCDTVLSTFEMYGQVGADGSVTGQAGLFKNRELE